MKRLILLLSLMLLACLATAITLVYDGEFRTRAAFFDSNAFGRDGLIDGRLMLGLNANLTDDLKVRAHLKFGDVTWGDDISGGNVFPDVSITAFELYADYRFKSCKTSVRVGQQYLSTPMGLVLDDAFSGLMLSNDGLLGMKTDLGVGRTVQDSVGKTSDFLLFNTKTNCKYPIGLFASYLRNGITDNDSAVLMPYFSMKTSHFVLDASLFTGMRFNDSPFQDQLGFGGAAKAKFNFCVGSVGLDVLASTKNGIYVISPWYVNGLYIYGIGAHNERTSLFWNDPATFAPVYSQNTDTIVSAVGGVSITAISKLNLFANIGHLLNKGSEANIGLEYSIIPGSLILAGYGAYGIHISGGKGFDLNGPTNFAAGSTLKVTF